MSANNITHSTLEALKVSSFFFLSVLLLILIHERVNPAGEKEFTRGRDVFFIYQDAQMLAEGKNPYQRIKDQNLTENQKYTFYLPGFLLSAAAAVKFGLSDYQSWMKAWLSISMLFHLGIGVLLFFLLYERGKVLPACLASSFWLFSRWPLALFRSGQIDAIPIFFFVLSLLLLKKNIRASLFALGISLGIKQMAAFLVPFFLIWAWKTRSSEQKPRKFLGDCLFLLLAPFLFSLPFLIWDAESFIRMIVFPLTRDPRGARSVDLFLQLPVEIQKIPFLLLLLSTYWLGWKERLDRASLLFFGMMLFLSFNSVFFSRYFCWAIPLIPLVCLRGLFPNSLGSEDSIAPKENHPETGTCQPKFKSE